MLLAYFASRRPIVEVDATSQDVEVHLPLHRLAPPSVFVRRLDSSANAMTIVDEHSDPVATAPADTVLQLASNGAAWLIVGQYPGGSSVYVDCAWAVSLKY